MAGLLARLFGRSAPVEQRRSMSSVDGWGVGVHAGGSVYNAALLENLGTVTACINAIASALASLPALVYRREGNSRIEAPNHPIARLIEAPNEHQTWPDWIEWLIAQTLLHGNGVALIEHDGAGRPIALRPIPWQHVMVSLVNGRLTYDVQPYSYPLGAGSVAPGRYLADEILHLRDRSDDGLIGRARLSRAPELLAGALALQQFSTATWLNSATPHGVLEHPGVLGPEARDFITRSFTEKFAGPANARRMLLLEEGMKFSAADTTPHDAELLETRRWTVTELCRLMQVPPPIVQAYENNTFTNAQQADQWFARHSLMPWAAKIEREFARSVFGSGSDFHLEIDLSGLVRGSYSERWAANVAAVQAGILTADEVREAEGYGPRAMAAEDTPDDTDA